MPLYGTDNEKYSIMDELVCQELSKNHIIFFFYPKTAKTTLYFMPKLPPQFAFAVQTCYTKKRSYRFHIKPRISQADPSLRRQVGSSPYSKVRLPFYTFRHGSKVFPNAETTGLNGAFSRKNSVPKHIYWLRKHTETIRFPFDLQLYGKVISY